MNTLGSYDGRETIGEYRRVGIHDEGSALDTFLGGRQGGLSGPLDLQINGEQNVFPRVSRTQRFRTGDTKVIHEHRLDPCPAA